MFENKTGYYLQLLTAEIIKLHGSTENKIIKDKNGENVILIHSNIFNNDYQQDPKVLYTFVPNKPFGSFLEIVPTSFIFLKTFNLELSYIEVWFTNQSSQPLEIEDRMSLTLVIKWYSYYKNALFNWR